MVDLGVAYEEDLDRVPAVLGQKARAFAQEPEIAGQLIEAPTVVGPLDLGDWAVTVRVMIKTLPVGCGACAAETLARSVRARADHTPLSTPEGDGARLNGPGNVAPWHPWLLAISASLRRTCRSHRGRS